MTVQQREDAQHVLVVLVQSHGLGIGLKEGHVLLAEESLRELVDVDRLVVALGIRIVEGGLRDEVHDVLLVVYLHHRTVHPALVFRHKGQVGTGVVEQHAEQSVAQDEVALDEQRVVFLQPVLHQRE